MSSNRKVREYTVYAVNKMHSTYTHIYYIYISNIKLLFLMFLIELVIFLICLLSFFFLTNFFGFGASNVSVHMRELKNPATCFCCPAFRCQFAHLLIFCVITGSRVH